MATIVIMPKLGLTMSEGTVIQWLKHEGEPVNEGEGLGIFNAMTALANVAGAVAGGWVAGRWGYSFLPLLAVVGISLGLAISGVLRA